MTLPFRRRPRLFHAAFIGVVLGAGTAIVAVAPTSTAATSQPLQILSLSNRADLLSAGDALIEIRLPAGVPARAVKVDVSGRDITGAFRVRQDGRFYGRVDKLPIGRSTVTARASAGQGARLVLTNHPQGGPVFSGPQVQPWVCTTEAAGLGKARDAQCNGLTTYTFMYKDAVTGRFAAYDPESPPVAARIATTTTDRGVTVPYIVRDERGTLDRGIYDIAVLFDPAKTFEPWAPQPAWNHKLGFKFGSSCSPGHSQAAPADPMDDMMLSRGFAVAVSSVNVFGNVCNHVVAAESVMMIKERLQERYGPIRYTIGSGCSGGSEAQNTIAENYPGLLDGILPTCTFADGWTPALMDKFDCPLLNHYFNQVSPQLWAAEPQRAAVLGGNLSQSICVEADVAFSAAPWDPTTGCAIDGDPRLYNAQTNRGGVRCTMQDYNVNALGRRPDGRANGVNDHVGLEWGRKALDDGLILPEQFVDLNEKIGGFDLDFAWQPQRTTGDLAGIARMYRTGQLTYGRNLAMVPSIDARADDTYDFHSNRHRLILRARMDRSVGNHNSQAYWFETNPGAFGAPFFLAEKSFDAMDRWLAAIEKDHSADPLEVKVVRGKPADVKDQCFAAGQPADDSTCDTTRTVNILPRQVAGMPATGDVLKCQLKPLREKDFNVTFTADQWSRLQKAFPTGVCDFSKRSLGFSAPVAAKSWLALSSTPGGQTLPAAPVSVPLLGRPAVAAPAAGESSTLAATGPTLGLPLLGISLLLMAGAAAGIRRATGTNRRC